MGTPAPMSGCAGYNNRIDTCARIGPGAAAKDPRRQCPPESAVRALPRVQELRRPRLRFPFRKRSAKSTTNYAGFAAHGHDKLRFIEGMKARGVQVSGIIHLYTP